METMLKEIRDMTVKELSFPEPSKKILKNISVLNLPELKPKEILLSRIVLEKYPNVLYLTNNMLNMICGKHNLVFGAVSFFLGQIPVEARERLDTFIEQLKRDKELNNLVIDVSKQEVEVKRTDAKGNKKSTKDLDDDHLINIVSGGFLEGRGVSMQIKNSILREFMRRGLPTTALSGFYKNYIEEEIKLESFELVDVELFLAAPRYMFKADAQQIGNEIVRELPTPMINTNRSPDPILMVKCIEGYIVVDVWGEDIPNGLKNELLPKLS